MKKLYNKLIILLFLLALIIIQPQVDAAIKLPSLIGTNMVLQQNTTIKGWGWADAGETIINQASWNTSIASATNTAEGNWKVIINISPDLRQEHGMSN